MSRANHLPTGHLHSAEGHALALRIHPMVIVLLARIRGSPDRCRRQSVDSIQGWFFFEGGSRVTFKTSAHGDLRAAGSSSLLARLGQANPHLTRLWTLFRDPDFKAFSWVDRTIELHLACLAVTGFPTHHRAGRPDGGRRFIDQHNV